MKKIITKKRLQVILCNYSLFVFLLLMISCIKQNEKKHKEVESVYPNTAHNNKSPLEVPFPNSNRKPIFTQKHSNLDGIVSEFVRKQFQDKNGTLWFGTNGDDIASYDGKFLEHYTINDGIGGSAVRGIVEDSDGNIWFGTSGGLTKYDGESFTNFSEAKGLLNNEIWSLEIDHNGILWVGSMGGLNTFDGKTFTVFHLPKAPVNEPNPMLSKERISKILEDRKGNMWFIRDGYGITIYNPKVSLKPNENSFTHLTEKDGLPDNNVADLLEDSKGNIWIGTMYGGVSCYDGKTFINYTKSGVIEGNETYNFCEDKKGNVWFSAENIGVYRYDGKSFKKFSEKDGLATNGIQSIFEDQKGQIWFGTWSGLSIYDGKLFFNAKDKEPWTN